MPVALQINWQEFLETYNRMHKANFKAPQAMVAALYAREGTLIKVADILGISDNSVSLFMMKHGLPRKPKGHRGDSKLQIAFRKIKNPGQYKHRELAKMLGCSLGYVSSLARKYRERRKNGNKQP